MDWMLKKWREDQWMKPLVREPAMQADHALKANLGIPWTALFLTVLSVLGLAASLVEYVRWHTAIALATIILWAVILFILIVLQPRTSSLMLILLYIAVTVCQAVPLAYPVNHQNLAIYWETASAVLSFVSLATVLSMQLRHPVLSREGISKPFTPPTAELRSPEENLTMWQWMTVSWMAPLMTKGSERQLNDDDVWQLPYEFQHNPLHDAFSNLSGTVVARLLKANWLDLFLLTLLACIDLAANYSVPVITQRLLQAMQDIEHYKSPALAWAVLILLAEVVTAQSAVFGTWFGRRTYERTRGALIMMIHQKVLHRKVIGGKPQDESEKENDAKAAPIQKDSPPVNGGVESPQETLESSQPVQDPPSATSSWRTTIRATIRSIRQYLPFQKKSTPDAKQPASVGKIYNLMRYDAYEVAQRFWEFQSLVTAPVGLVVSLVLVWRMIGWPSLVGITVVVVAQVVNGFLARGLLKNELKRRKATDDKLQQITQYIDAIRHLRWYGWHMRKIESVFSARQKELNLRIVSFLWNNAIVFINTFASGLLPVAAFWAYTTLAGWELTVDVAFPALQLFTLLQTNLREIPNLITVLLNAAVALRRIEDFMVEPDVESKSTSQIGDCLELRKASFSWPGVEDTVLHELNLTFPPGLTTIIGQVASGKTALLQALLGELDMLEGQLIRPDAPIGYCAQTPWLESMSIRDNILFCSPYEEQRYKHVVEACALLPDLASFQQGDLSPIGENGIGLSGGQKARVALARAIYSRSPILLLDDPLSALDQQTAEWIVARCFSGSLIQDRTVLLVTHRTDLCQGISKQIVEMSDKTARLYTDVSSAVDGSLHLTKTESPSEEFKQAQESAAIKDKFEDEEYRAHGGVKWRVYWEYITAGRVRWWFGALCGLLLWRLCDYAQSWFLKEWGEAYKSIQAHALLTLQSVITRISQGSPLSRFFDQLPRPAENPTPWLTWFAIIVVFQSLAFLFAQMMMITVTYTAGKRMFRQIMLTISNATFRFYDVTPAGRLMNRLTGDMGTIDGAIASVLINFAWTSIAWATSLVVIAAVTPLFTIISLALAAGFVYVFSHFLPTSQSLRRLETVSLSPLMSNFGALLSGLVTVRAFHAQFQFHDRVVATMDKFQLMDHFYWSLQTWLTYRFQVLSAVSTLVLTLIAIYSGFTAGLTAFVLIAAQKFVQATFGLCKQYGTLQLDFVSVERVVELVHLEQEDPGDKQPPAYWPLLSSKNPAVEFEDVTIRYAPELDPALQNISFSIPSGSSTAIIGRTGSGKSTLALALLATIKADSGRILVDGLDISQVSKQDLRSRVTFLAQDPILFEGTIRINLDPMDDYSDDECLSVLQRIHGDTRYQWTLDTSVEAGGRNLSQGQRQLVGLARSMLRRSAIIIMDEATASVDLETSWEIQRVLKEELAGSTVITIAHRASAVRDCDLVIKLDKGHLSAFGTPEEVEVGGAVDPSLGDETLIPTETGESSSSNDSQHRLDNRVSENVQERLNFTTLSTVQDTAKLDEEDNKQSILRMSEHSATETAKADVVQSSRYEAQATDRRNIEEAVLEHDISSNEHTNTMSYSDAVKKSVDTAAFDTSTSHSSENKLNGNQKEAASVTDTKENTEMQTRHSAVTGEVAESTTDSGVQRSSSNAEPEQDSSTAREWSRRRSSRSSNNDDMVIF